MTAFVDFHCHLDLYPDHARQVEDCEKAALYTLAVTTTPKAWKRNHELVMQTKYVRAALGLHPQLVAERATELSLWDDLLPEARYIGEVGLDASPRYFRSLPLQQEVFHHILAATARVGGKVLSVHSVRAVTKVLDCIEAHFPKGVAGRIVLHWFTGSLSEARRALDLGCFFSVNMAMLEKQSHLKMVATFPSERLLTETDGPFAQASSSATERAAEIMQVVRLLAEKRNMACEAMQIQILENLGKLSIE
ncbi:MAG TPA: Qat anti-phage system TatD family nuclease QatD [Acidisarcina sp.]